jgi:hypothetical protein
MHNKIKILAVTALLPFAATIFSGKAQAMDSVPSGSDEKIIFEWRKGLSTCPPPYCMFFKSMADKKDFLKEIKQFIDLKKDIVIRTPKPSTDLMRTIVKEDIMPNITAIKFSLDNGAKAYIDDQTIDGHNALLFANHFRRNPEAVKAVVTLLKRYDANINARSRYSGRTSLMYKCLLADVSSVEFLIDFHADVNLKDSGDNTALDYAESALNCVRYFKSESEANPQYSFGCATPSDDADYVFTANTRDLDSIEKSIMEIMEILKKAGAKSGHPSV